MSRALSVRIVLAVMFGAIGCPQTSATAPDAAADAGWLPAGCDLDREPKDAPACVDDRVGVFVSPFGTNTGTGTKDDPVSAMFYALELLDGILLPGLQHPKSRIYVCDGDIIGGVTIHKGVAIYGGFDCSSWSYTGKKSKLSNLACDGAPAPVSLTDIEVNPSLPVGVSVNACADFTLARVTVRAFKGQNGSDSVVPPFLGDGGEVYDASPAFYSGSSAVGPTGGAAVVFACSAGGVTMGGRGGDAAKDGLPGSPSLDGGAGGLGGSSCVVGGNGAAASPGDAGTGGRGFASFDPLRGPIGASGAPGANGGPGQGGGGGGGVDDGVNQGGGGGGGVGGCGGLGGRGGGPGESSIALLSVNSSIHIRQSLLVAGDGGRGGSGSPGSASRPAAPSGGKGAGPGCSGGVGGVGGVGGAGGGGAGGFSIGIAYKGNRPDYGADTMIVTSAAGVGGVSPVGGACNGGDGLAQAELELP